MDKTICSDPLTVPSDDDVPFADERHRYLCYCEGSGATTRSLKAKRNELLGSQHASVQTPQRASISRHSDGSRPSAPATKWGEHRDATRKSAECARST